ncbi:MAG: shikimate dehydrogenase [Clostridia bacterium]|nr:shikimate dehydrogenase [Clostridia bacterium]
MKHFNLALIGKDVTQSHSPAIHAYLAKKLGYTVNFKNLSVPEAEFESSIENIINSYDGFNVTIPYKLAIIPHLEKTEGDAAVFGAVNTVKSSSRTGYNTDGHGFCLMLKNGGVEISGKTFLVIGAGGAGRSVVKTLLDEGAKVYLYNRTYEKALAVANEFGATALKTLEDVPYYAIINASGVGMHKTVGMSPCGESLLKLCEVAIDLIYEPPHSEFLRLAEGLGKKILNGIGMLFYQAYYSACIFAGITPDEAMAKEYFHEFLKETK